MWQVISASGVVCGLFNSRKEASRRAQKLGHEIVRQGRVKYNARFDAVAAKGTPTVNWDNIGGKPKKLAK